MDPIIGIISTSGKHTKPHNGRFTEITEPFASPKRDRRSVWSCKPTVWMAMVSWGNTTCWNELKKAKVWVKRMWFKMHFFSETNINSYILFCFKFKCCLLHKSSIRSSIWCFWKTVHHLFTKHIYGFQLRYLAMARDQSLRKSKWKSIGAPKNMLTIKRRTLYHEWNWQFAPANRSSQKEIHLLTSNHPFLGVSCWFQGG